MGFFSFKTQDERKSIANKHSGKKTFIVYMKDNKGNVWVECNYGGYGEFGGKDFFELLAEMNGLKTRDEGIELFYEGENFLCPNLFSKMSSNWKNEIPKHCKKQGYFY